MLLCYQPTYEELKRLVKEALYPVPERYQPTYEELKLQKRLFSDTRFGGCQPTYEELKRLAFAASFWQATRCQPTYEELKPSSARRINCWTGVASLPMRN